MIRYRIIKHHLTIMKFFIFIKSQLCTSNNKIQIILHQIQNLFLTAHSTQNKLVVSVPIKDIIHHYPMALFYDIPGLGRHARVSIIHKYANTY